MSLNNFFVNHLGVSGTAFYITSNSEINGVSSKDVIDVSIGTAIVI